MASRSPKRAKPSTPCSSASSSRPTPTGVPAELSGGQQQRVAIVRAIAIKPRFLVFDEPTSALDPEMTAEVLDFIAELRSEGRDLIIVTHNMGFARQVSDYCVFISEGRAVEEGRSAEVFSRPRTPELEGFLAKVLRY
jgi:polar amino acid transport system ATP-binding protein